MNNLAKVANDFEAIFIYRVIQEMRKTIQKPHLFYGGRAEEIFTQLLDWELSKSMAKKNIFGIAQNIIKQYQNKQKNSVSFSAGEDKKDLVSTLAGSLDLNTHLLAGSSAGLSGISPAGKIYPMDRMEELCRIL